GVVFCVFSVPINSIYCFFCYNYTARSSLYTLSLHDALPISSSMAMVMLTALPWPFPVTTGTPRRACVVSTFSRRGSPTEMWTPRSEEHTSELQSRGHLVCRLLLEKKKPHK